MIDIRSLLIGVAIGIVITLVFWLLEFKKK